jgi:hypothetical protein
LPTDVAAFFPSYNATIPIANEAPDVGNETNPFVTDAQDLMLHPRLHDLPPFLRQDANVVDAFIKVEWNAKNKSQQKSRISEIPLRYLNGASEGAQDTLPMHVGEVQHLVAPVDPLPPNFGDVKVAPKDRELWRFCKFTAPLTITCGHSTC